MNKSSNQEKKTGLGKGLSALFEENPNASFADTGFLPKVNIDSIAANPSQPRRSIAPEDLVGLADSIREHGVIEPLIVTANKEIGGADYTLIAGERRWRAALLAQLETVPVIVKEASPQQILEMAVIENIQRQDLNALEEAYAISELHNTFGVKIADIAKKIGKDTSTLSNKLRLLKLPIQIQEGILEGTITESHAYQILTLGSNDARLAAYQLVKKRRLSVRETEQLVKRLDSVNQGKLRPKAKQNDIIDEKSARIEADLTKILGQGVKLVKKRSGGRLTIPFSSDKQLEKLYELLRSNY
ncbi:MAG: ParB/RepB/Spo0J family partition protein [Candidatus Dojkabacteria bacterium]